MRLRDMSPIALLQASQADAPALSVLATCVYVATYCDGVLRDDQAREALAQYSVVEFQRRLETGHHIVLARADRALVGFADWVPSTAGPEFADTAVTAHTVALQGAPELCRLYVAPAAQGRAVGTALLRHCEQAAQATGAVWLWLTAWAHNDRALHFYARQGYTDIGRSHYVFEDQVFDNRVLVKALQS